MAVRILHEAVSNGGFAANVVFYFDIGKGKSPDGVDVVIDAWVIIVIIFIWGVKVIMLVIMYNAHSCAHDFGLHAAFGVLARQSDILRRPRGKPS